MQDAAAALPVNLFGDLRGARRRRPLRGAGRKNRAARSCRREGNRGRSFVQCGSTACARTCARLSLKAETVAADALEWQAEPFDAILLDAPCSSTGTIRRHPDVPWLKSEADLSALTSLQHRLLDRAVEMLKPGGTLVYCVCSLEPEEGEDQITALLTRDPRVTRKPVTPQDVFDRREFVTDDGDLRTLPMHLPDSDPRWGGLDGFYAARLTRKSA